MHSINAGKNLVVLTTNNQGKSGIFCVMDNSLLAPFLREHSDSRGIRNTSKDIMVEISSFPILPILRVQEARRFGR